MGNLMTSIFQIRTTLIALALFFPSKQVLAIGLTEILDRTLSTNVQIIAAENDLEMQSEVIKQILSRKKPVVSANVSSERIWDLKNDDNDDGYSAGITARYMLFDGYMTNHQIAAENYRIKALKSEVQGIGQRIIYDSIIAYLSVLRNSQLVDLSKKNTNVLSQQLDATTSRYQLGELTRTDVAQATAALESAKESTRSSRCS